MALPILEPSPSETLAERCARLAQQVADYEADISNTSLLELTQIREALQDAAAVDRLPSGSYDTHQRNAAHLCWTCCKVEVFATNPAMGCATCR